LEAFLDEKPGRRETFKSAYDQIILADINENSEGWETENYCFDEKYILEAFTDRGFKTIIGKAWSSWTQVMERLNNDTNECNA
jgi:hypothetical protein